MHIVKRINHNAVVCLDSKGREVVALGRGIGFPDQGDEVDIARINRTYYNVDDRYLQLFEEIPLDVLDCAAQIVDVIRSMVPYELSPSYPLTLADHIAFMLKRAREHIKVSMPLSYDIAQFYPLEYRLGAFAVERIERAFHMRLNDGEAAGIAMSILAAAAPQGPDDDRVDPEALLDQITELIERDLAIHVDRAGVAFARFATHVNYLIHGRGPESVFESGGGELLAMLQRDYPEVVVCAGRVATHLAEALNSTLNDGERVFLALHLSRLYTAANPPADAASSASSNEPEA